jgi:hypothetical protein
MEKDIACQEIHNEVHKEVHHEVRNEVHNKGDIRSEGEAYNEGAYNKRAYDKLPEVHNKEISTKEINAKEPGDGELSTKEIGHKEVPNIEIPDTEVLAQKVRHDDALEEEDEKEDDELKIRGIKVDDPLLMQLEDEVTGFINRRLEEHVAKRIKGLLVPVAKLSLKVQRMRKRLAGGQAGEATGETDEVAGEADRQLLDLEDDLDYILENSKLRRISPQVGERFNPALHEEVDFSWNPDQSDSHILATLRDGFFWEYNQEMIIKPQVVVNRRLAE